MEVKNKVENKCDRWDRRGRLVAGVQVGGGGGSACSQAQEGRGPTHQTMPVLKGQNGRELVGMRQMHETPC